METKRQKSLEFQSRKNTRHAFAFAPARLCSSNGRYVHIGEEVIKPLRLKKGDNIAIISPSWGGPSLFPKIFESGLENLKAMGLNPVEFSTARMDAKELYKNPQKRAEDINTAFSDRNIHGIIASIGGTDSVRILKYLDIDLIKNNPKFLMGFSDVTTLTTFINQLGLVTFNGPSIMAGFSQLRSLSEDYKQYLSEYLIAPREHLELPMFPNYSDGYPDWRQEKNIGKVKPLKSTDGPHFIQGAGKSTGELFGGCIEVLEMMKGTDFWPRKEFWENKILFLETSEEKPSIDYVQYWLRNYGAMEVFDSISGFLFSRPRDYADEEKDRLEEMIITVIKDEFGNSELPIVTNMDFGHTDPQLILPLGIKFEINMEEKKIIQLEAAFRSGT